MNKKVQILILTIMMTLSMTTFAYASSSGGTSVNDILAPLENLKILLTAIVAGIGYILAIKNGLELFTSWQNADQHGMTQALKGLVGGIILAAIGTVMTFLGF